MGKYRKPPFSGKRHTYKIIPQISFAGYLFSGRIRQISTTDCGGAHISLTSNLYTVNVFLVGINPIRLKVGTV